MSLELTDQIESYHSHSDAYHNDVSSTGNYLQRVRLSKKISEADVMHRLKIKPRIIHAIENHHYDCLPDVTTVSALVRQYAQFLGLNGIEIARNYKNEMSGTEQKLEINFPERLPSSFRPVKKASIITLGLLGVFGLWNFLGSKDNLIPKITSQKAITQLVSLPQTPNKIEKNTLINNGKYTLDIIPVIHFTVVKKPEVVIQANGGEAWIEVKNSANKQIIFSGILKDNSTYVVPNNIDGLILKAGNSAPLSISVNGRTLDVLPKSSRVLRNFSLNPQELLKVAQTQPVIPSNNNVSVPTSNQTDIVPANTNLRP